MVPTVPLSTVNTTENSGSHHETPKYTKQNRLRSKNKDGWWDEKRKKNRNSGLAYEYKVKGNLQVIKKAEARKIGPPCKCQKKCFDILGSDAINNIFKDYWALADYNLQTMDLQKKLQSKISKGSEPKMKNVLNRVHIIIMFTTMTKNIKYAR